MVLLHLVAELIVFVVQSVNLLCVAGLEVLDFLLVKKKADFW